MTAKPRRGLTEQAADAAVDQACRMLHLPTIRAQFPDLADAAAREQMSYRGFLAEMLMAECDDRARRRSERQIKAAGFPREKSLRAFDFDANPSIDPAVINTLATCDWVKKGLPLCLIGDSGTGKSHLLIALGTEAAMAGYRVRYTLAAKLVNELVEAADDKQLTKTINRYGRVDLLCVDELGYMELDRRGAELLFQVLTEREEKASVAIASNESFSGWTKTFTDPRLCAAIVDRLTFGGNIIETGTDSYRLAQTRAAQQTYPAPPCPGPASTPPTPSSSPRPSSSSPAGSPPTPSASPPRCSTSSATPPTARTPSAPTWTASPSSSAATTASSSSATTPIYPATPTRPRSKLTNKNHPRSRQVRSKLTNNRGQNSRTKPRWGRTGPFMIFVTRLPTGWPGTRACR